MLFNLVSKLISIGDECDSQFQEFHNSLTLMIIGCWWLLHSKLGLVVDSSASVAMRSVAPLSVWGAVLIIQSVLQLWFLLNGYRKYRRGFCFSSVVIWTFLSIFFFLAGRNLFAVPVSCMFAAGSAWGYIHLGRSARNAVPDSRYRQLHL